MNLSVGRLLNIVTAHWLFYPLLLLVILIISYIVFFSTNGYFAYQNRNDEKQQLQYQITLLESEIKSLQKKTKADKSDILLRLGISEAGVKILRFQKQQKLVKEKTEERFDIAQMQRLFTISGTAMLFLITLVAFRFRREEPEEENH